MTIRKVKTKDGQVKWEVRYHLGGRGSKRVNRRFNTRTEAEAHIESRIAERKKLKLSPNELGDFEATNFRKEAEYWLSHRGQTFSPGHLKRAKGILEELLPKYGSLSPKVFHSGMLTQIQTELAQNKSNASTVNRKTEIIAAILNFSARNHRIPYNPAVGFQKLKETREEMNFWELDEAREFLAFCNKKYKPGSANRWIYVSYLLSLNTGMRAGETWGLQSGDLKKDGRVLHVQRQFDRITQTFRTPKGKRSRFVPCNDELRKELLEWIKFREVKNSETVFQNEKRRPVCHDNFVKRVFDNDVREAKVLPIRFHDLRHTATTLMIAQGLNLNTVKEICGHQNIQTTMNYVHLLGESIVQSAELFSVKPKEPTAQHPHLVLIKA